MFQDKLECPQHLSDETLIRYLDGELPPAEAASTKEHLEACWGCRGRAEEFQQTVLSFLDYEKLALTKLGEPPRHWGGFGSRLNQQAAALASQGKELSRSLWTEIEASLAYLLQPQRAMAILTSVMMVWWLFYAETRITASEVFEHAESSEALALKPYQHPVIHQTIRVQKKSSSLSSDQAVSLEIWTDTRSDLVRRSAQGWTSVARKNQTNPSVITEARSANHPAVSAPPVVTELQQLYQFNHLDWAQPLSSSAFRAWSTQNSSNQVRLEKSTLPNGEKSWTLSATVENPAGVGGIQAADLVVRTSDWHPVAERFRVRSDHGEQVYELNETNFEVVSLDTVSPAIFEMAPEATPPIVSTEIVAPSPTPLNPAEMEATEMSARWALHQIKADLGEPIEIVRKTNEVEVHALTDSLDRKIQMAAALDGIPHLAININTIQELKQSQQKAGSKPNAPSSLPSQARSEGTPAKPEGLPAVSEIVTGRPPIQDQLEEYFVALRKSGNEPGKATSAAQENVEGQIQELSKQALALSDAALSEAWALRRLAKRYPAEELSKLPPQSRNQLDDLVRDHLRNIREDITKGRSLLEPVLSSLLNQTKWEAKPREMNKSRQEPLQAVWPEFPSPLFDVINYMDRITTGLFAGTGFPVEDYKGLSTNRPLRIAPPEKYMADLLLSYSIVEEELSSLEKQVSTHSIDHR
jgi:hypothetical protein